MLRTILILLLFNFMLISYSHPETKEGDEKSGRPKVGLVLSGGGAKGFAYIGLFRVLQEVGLKIDYIGGTSIGSIMAAMYASGYSPDEMEKIIRGQNWDKVIKDEIPRKYIAYEEKEFLENSIISFAYKRRKINLQSSLYKGQQVNLLLNRFLSKDFEITDFNNLNTPFICVGTDLLTGEAITLNSGYLPMAVRSSMSIPGYFSPTFYQGRYLVDGGVVDNFPAKQVQEMGAQFLIGGNVQSGLVDSIAKLNTITSVLDQIISFSRASANELADSLVDYQIHYKIKQGMMDFDMYDSIIAYGEREARKHYDELKKLADSLNSIEEVPLTEFNAQPLKEVYIRNVEYHGNKKMSSIYLDNFFDRFENTSVKIEEIEEMVTRVYGSRFFEYVFYELRPAGDGKADLIIKMQEGAPGYLTASLHYDSDYLGSIMVNGVFRNILGNRSKLFASVVFGTNPRVKALYYISNGPKPGPGIELDFYSFRFNEYEKDKKVNSIRFINNKVMAFAGSVLKNLYSFRAGFEYEYFSLKPDIEDSLLAQFSDFNSYLNAFISFRADTRDRPHFSTSGVNSQFIITYIMPIGNDWSKEIFTNSLMYYLKYDQNISLSKRFVLKPGLFLGGTIKQDVPPIHHWYGVGGLTTINYLDNFVYFTGVNFVQSYGLYSAVGRLKLQYNLMKNLFLTVRSDFGANELDYQDLVKSENFMFGYGLTAGYKSYIGPIEVTLMSSNINSGASLYFSLGFDF